MWAGFDAEQQRVLMAEGILTLPSEYSDDGYRITRRLIEDGRNNLVLREPLDLPFPVRLLHGTADEDVAMSVPLRILEHATGSDIQLTFVKGVDHRFSTDLQLNIILDAILEVSAISGGKVHESIS